MVAFEAVPDNARCVVDNAERNGLRNVVVEPVAVGKGGGVARLTLAEHPGGAVLASAGSPPDAVGTIEVPVVALDDLIEAGQVPVPDVVKIDVEGAEEAVLDGMRRTMSVHRPVLVIEVDDATTEGMEARVAEFVDRLVGAGYQVTRLAPSYDAPDWSVAHLVAVGHDAGSNV